MKKLIYILLVVLSTSCARGEMDYILNNNPSPGISNQEIEAIIQQDELFSKENESILMDLRSSSIILSEYIKLENNNYSLEISEDAAVKLGVSEINYKLIREQIEETNKVISEAINQGQEVNLIDIQAQAKAYKIPQREVSRNRSMMNASRSAGGIIRTTSAAEGKASFEVETGISKVILKCGTYWAPVATYTCVVTCFGPSKTYIATGGIYCRRTIEAPLAASGSKTTATIQFRTTDPNGGYCIWTPSI